MTFPPSVFARVFFFSCFFISFFLLVFLSFLLSFFSCTIIEQSPPISPLLLDNPPCLKIYHNNNNNNNNNMPISLWRGSHKRKRLAGRSKLLRSYSFACTWLGQTNDSAPAAVAQRSSSNSRTNHHDIFCIYTCTFYPKKESILSIKASYT